MSAIKQEIIWEVHWFISLNKKFDASNDIVFSEINKALALRFKVIRFFNLWN